MQNRQPSDIVAIGTAAASPLLMGGTRPRADFNARLLAAHNAERAQLGVPPLPGIDIWPRTPGTGPTSSPRRAVSNIRPDEPGKSREGENLWAGTPRAFSPEAMVELWAAEKRTTARACSRTTAARAMSRMSAITPS